MYVEKIHLPSLQNEEHAGLMSYALTYAKEIPPQEGNISRQISELETRLDIEKTALDLVQKNSFTKKVNEADATCDIAIRGFFGSVKSQLNHYDLAIAEAAHRINIICDTFRDLPTRPRKSQTQGEEQLLDELKKANADIQLLGMGGWVQHIEDAHSNFVTISSSRNTEDDAKPEFNMRDARLATDVAYKVLVDRVNAFITIDGGSQYAAFVSHLNGRITEYANTLARRKAGNKKDETDSTTK